MNRKMKVVWFCNYSLLYLKDKLNLDLDFSSMHPVPWLYYLVQEISTRRNLDLHIITLKNIVRKDYHITEGNVTYHILSQMPSSVPKKGSNYIYKYFNFLLKCYWSQKLSRLMKAIKPDIINAHGTEGELQVMINKYKIPSLIWMQGMMNDVIKINKNKKYLKWLRNENQIIHNQKYFIAFPGDMQAKIKKMNSGVKLFTLYHPNPDYAFDLYEREYESNADIIYVGELVKRKGIEDFITAVFILKKLNPGIKAKIICFIGNKEYYNQIIKQIQEMGLQSNIIFRGFLEDHADVLKEMKKSKVLVLPTYVDTGPRVVAESMTVGVPVVSYNIDGLPAMIRSGEDGILVEKGKIDQLVKAIQELLNNEEMRTAITQKAFEVAKDKYSAPKVVDELIDIYKKVISDSRLTHTVKQATISQVIATE